MAQGAGVAALLSAIAMAPACGAKTDPVILDVATDAAPPVDAPQCTADAECDGFGDRCVPVACIGGRCTDLPAKDCDDHDACTKDDCDSTTGACSHVPSTPDVDGDGHRAPLPGHVAADAGSCGDDCNDADPSIHPGAKDTCSKDNNCDGKIDPFHYVPADATMDARRLSGEIAPVDPSGVAWSGDAYMTAYTGTPASKYRVYTSRLDPKGVPLAPESQFVDITADSVGGSVVWTGAQYGIMWSDRRADWETYFNRMNAKGEKLGPDVRVSDPDPSWSLGTSLVWTGTEYVIAWQDQRDLSPDFTIYAQRLDDRGSLVGANVKLDDVQGESPSAAVGTGTIGISWTHTDGASHSIWMAVFDRTLKKLSKSIELTTSGLSGRDARVVWSKKGYVVAWYDPDSSLHAVYGAIIDEKGAIVVAPKKLTDSARYSRYPDLLPYGDHVLLVWSDTKDGNKGYELYSKLLDDTLASVDTEQRLTNAIGDSVFPVASSGPDGEVGVLFRDDRTGAPHVYFTRLVCETKSK